MPIRIGSPRNRSFGRSWSPNRGHYFQKIDQICRTALENRLRLGRSRRTSNRRCLEEIVVFSIRAEEIGDETHALLEIRPVSGAGIKFALWGWIEARKRLPDIRVGRRTHATIVTTLTSSFAQARSRKAMSSSRPKTSLPVTGNLAREIFFGASRPRRFRLTASDTPWVSYAGSDERFYAAHRERL
jgi:hypothetical protein